jgi:hypothetical protein
MVEFLSSIQVLIPDIWLIMLLNLFVFQCCFVLAVIYCNTDKDSNYIPDREAGNLNL